MSVIHCEQNALLGDGNVRIWKDYCAMAEQKLVTTFSSIRRSDVVIHNLNAVVDWQQISGYLV